MALTGQIFPPGVSASAGGSSGGSPSTNDFRLTLSSGNPVYSPQPATPSSTDTTNMTVTFSADPGWTNGTIATVSATVGGLTAGTIYYIRRRSSTLYSFHTSVAGAEGDTSKVTLSANITSEVRPSGVSSTSIKLSPYRGNSLGLYSSGSWSNLTSAEISLALGTLTSGTNYDVFAYNNSGAIAIELGPAWTNNTTRATALASQDGILVKSGDAARRFMGTLRADSTTTTIVDAGGLASQIGGKCLVWNDANRVSLQLIVYDGAASWTYNVATVRQANGAAGNKVEFVIGLAEDVIDVSIVYTVQAVSSGDNNGVGVDSTTAYRYDCLYSQIVTPSGISSGGTTRWTGKLVAGYHYLAWLEFSGGAAGIYYGRNNPGSAASSSFDGLTATVMA